MEQQNQPIIDQQNPPIINPEPSNVALIHIPQLNPEKHIQQVNILDSRIEMSSSGE